MTPQDFEFWRAWCGQEIEGTEDMPGFINVWFELMRMNSGDISSWPLAAQRLLSLEAPSFYRHVIPETYRFKVRQT